MPSHAPSAAAHAQAALGTLGAREIAALVESGGISSDAGITPDQIQPASFDLTLSSECWRMPGSMLALAGERVRDLVQSMALDRLNLSSGTCLNRGQVYVVRLRERLRLPPGMQAYTNSKSSTGRIDLATRVVADGAARYDRVSPGHQGDIYLELIPRSFDVVLQSGDSLNQAIFFSERHVLTQAELLATHAAQPLALDDSGRALGNSCFSDGRLIMSADLATPTVGYVAKRSLKPVVLRQIAAHNPGDYFTPIPKPAQGMLFLEKGRFYILATAERVAVPLDLACEMVPYDAAAGEFRAHYAGFFDPGWGIQGGTSIGTKAVLEVRPHEDDLVLRDRQPICAMAYERLTSPCDRPYGGKGSHYASQQGPTLSKHFRLG